MTDVTETVAPASGIVLIVPAYNPDEHLVELLESVRPRWQGPVVVVNDGSAPASAATFDTVRALPGVILLEHDRNRGKGAALKTALAWARDNVPGFAGAVTADADGQHAVDDIVRVAQALSAHPGALVLGCRDFSAPDVPKKSFAGNRSMRIALRLFCGVKVSDTQTGLRGIPACMVDDLLNVKDDGYDFETTMLIDAQRLGVPFVEVPIRTIYLDGNSASHYRPVRDSLKIAAAFVKYALSSMTSSLVDLSVFTLLNVLLAMVLSPAAAIPLATYLARAVSSVVNFTINRKLVFQVKGHVLRYVAVVLASMTASAVLVTLVSQLTGFNATIVKMVVDFCLFFVNYALQHRWVFR